MLRVIELSRRQAFAGLVAGTFFSSACADEEQMHMAVPDADLAEEEAEDSSLAAEPPSPATRAPYMVPIVTPLPRIAPLTSPKAASRRKARHADPLELAVESLLVQAKEGEVVFEAQVSFIRKPATEPLLARPSMLGDSYAAFGANEVLLR